LAIKNKRNINRLLEKYVVGSSSSIFSDLHMRPTERELFKILINEPGREPLRKGRIVSHIVKEEITWGINNEGHLIMQIVGIQGGGKSTLALKIARMIQREWKKHGRDVDLYLTFSFSETVDKYKKLKPGDIIIQDEAPALAGYDARTVANQLENLQAIMRAQQNSWIFCYPVPIEQLVSPTLWLEVVGQFREKKQTLCVVYSRLRRCLGWAIIDVSEVLDDKEFYNWYLQEKFRNIEKIQSSGGLSSVTYSQEQLEEDLKKVLLVWKQRGAPEIKKRSQVEYLMFLAGIQGSDYYRRFFATYAMEEIQKILSGARPIDEIRPPSPFKEEAKKIGSEAKKDLEEALKKKKEEAKKAAEKKRKISPRRNFRLYLAELIKNKDEPPKRYKSIMPRSWAIFKKIVAYLITLPDDARAPPYTHLKDILKIDVSKLSYAVTNVMASGFVGDMFERFFYRYMGYKPPQRRMGNKEPDFIHPRTFDIYSLKTSMKIQKRVTFSIPNDVYPEYTWARYYRRDYIYFVFANPMWFADFKKAKIDLYPVPPLTITFYDDGTYKIKPRTQKKE